MQLIHFAVYLLPRAHDLLDLISSHKCFKLYIGETGRRLLTDLLNNFVVQVTKMLTNLFPDFLIVSIIDLRI